MICEELCYTQYTVWCCRQVIQLVWCGGCWPAKCCACVAASAVKYHGRSWSIFTSTATPMRRCPNYSCLLGIHPLSFFDLAEFTAALVWQCCHCLFSLYHHTAVYLQSLAVTDLPFFLSWSMTWMHKYRVSMLSRKSWIFFDFPGSENF